MHYHNIYLIAYALLMIMKIIYGYGYYVLYSSREALAILIIITHV